jgi:hypothetical protein
MEQLDAHCLTEHKCPHLGCTAQCKNAAPVKEHIRNKHNTKCDVICQGEFYLVDLLSLNHIFFMAGQRYQIIVILPPPTSTALSVHLPLTPPKIYKNIAKITPQNLLFDAPQIVIIPMVLLIPFKIHLWEFQRMSS